MSAAIHTKTERIDVRASPPVKQLLQEAARVAHKNVSEYLLVRSGTDGSGFHAIN